MMEDMSGLELVNRILSDPEAVQELREALLNQSFIQPKKEPTKSQKKRYRSKIQYYSITDELTRFEGEKIPRDRFLKLLSLKPIKKDFYPSKNIIEILLGREFDPLRDKVKPQTVLAFLYFLGMVSSTGEITQDGSCLYAYEKDRLYPGKNGVMAIRIPCLKVYQDQITKNPQMFYEDIQRMDSEIFPYDQYPEAFTFYSILDGLEINLEEIEKVAEKLYE